MDSSQNQSDSRRREGKALLTTDCYYVQGDMLDLAAALDAAALSGDPGRVKSQLAAVRECRQRLHDHRVAMEGPAGLYDYLETDSPAITGELGGLCAEHL